ncbi:bifunctional hydroxymethylpyrimidine kinase/phosphomethylpyrimidine kinase [Brachybacterium sp. P6-10-X1]|uniref:bifunctional hydroxymethylpyrimidine kinase/phosphomethylpyrimidine kinase n=1 Tax=Brachybacterium sp. P6-10-X1 TaxID=1903186 RepID=UPI0009718319|nr:bifunctional hydroxymethylpyrimidine kinase/phosphomethylpyrimidine kinase [Brachybacterium sp. P6-10-X1]APX32801.1 bifunctional hydroxymethylpyrimidine kinase/phosphomethylpyrimidine kinase [Brachybacterium sp. P6-10-X1]
MDDAPGATAPPQESSPSPERPVMRPPTSLTIAGSDSGGGAGIQADLKTFTALGVYGTSAITALTAQNTLGVQAVIPVAPRDVARQITSVLDDIPLDATKIGMLASAEVIAAVAETLESRREDLGRLVLDPVMVATSGDVLLPDIATDLLRERLLPLADVVTPNLPEAARLLGVPEATDVEAMCEQAEQLRGVGVDVVVLKGGHRAGDEIVDVVAHPGGIDLLRGERVRTRATHGTGCTLSAAIAAQYARLAVARNPVAGSLRRLATTQDAADELCGPDEQGSAAVRGSAGERGPARWRGDDLAAIAAARDFLQRALRGGAEQQLSFTPQDGHGPVDHLVTIARRPDRD